jgi:histone deacetylase 1/2
MIYWENAFQTATYVINRLPTPVLKHKSPFKMLYHKLPDYRFMRVFGCACWPNLKPYNKNKLNFRSKTCIFIGYSLCHQRYKCLDLSTGKIYVSRHVIFDETLFPYSKELGSVINKNPSSESVSLPHQISMPPSSCPTNLQPTHISTCIQLAPFILISAGTEQAPSPEISHAAVPPQHADTQSAPTNVHSMVICSKNNIHRPRQSSDDFIRYPLPRALIAENIPTEAEPTSYTQASKSLHWQEAMNKEFSALLHNGTWSSVSPPTTTNIVGCRWIYKIKKKADGTIERYKARLVAKGFHQQKGVDFAETFSPIIKHATIRLVISTEVSYNWPIKQLDV